MEKEFIENLLTALDTGDKGKITHAIYDILEYGPNPEEKGDRFFTLRQYMLQA